MSASEYFEKMLSGDFTEKDSDCISLGDSSVTFESLEKIINFLYTDQLEADKKVSLDDLLCTADYVQIQSAVDKINTLIRDEITKVNVLRFWALRSMMKDTEVIAELRKFILKNFQEIVFDVSFLNIDFETLSWIVESDELTTASEMEVYRAIKMWINHDHVARKKHFLDLFGCVRYDAKMTVSGDFILLSAHQRNNLCLPLLFFQMQFIMNDMLRDCECTESMDIIISHLAKRLNFTGELDLVIKARTGPAAN